MITEVVPHKEEFEKWNDETYCLNAVKQDGLKLQFVHNQTGDICMAAVKQYGGALRYVHNQTKDICMEAVKKDRRALNYIHDKDILVIEITVYELEG